MPFLPFIFIFFLPILSLSSIPISFFFVWISTISLFFPSIPTIFPITLSFLLLPALFLQVFFLLLITPPHFHFTILYLFIFSPRTLPLLPLSIFQSQILVSFLLVLSISFPVIFYVKLHSILFVFICLFSLAKHFSYLLHSLLCSVVFFLIYFQYLAISLFLHFFWNYW